MKDDVKAKELLEALELAHSILSWVGPVALWKAYKRAGIKHIADEPIQHIKNTINKAKQGTGR